MSGPWHPTGHARVNARFPEAQAVCDRCYRNFSLRDLRWQFQWAGLKLQNLGLRVCCECLDIPQTQLRTLILPPDPVPVNQPRIEQYDAEVPSYMATESPPFMGDDITTEAGNNLILEIGDTPLPDPNNPVSYP